MNDAADEPSKPTSAGPLPREFSDEELERILGEHEHWLAAEDAVAFGATTLEWRRALLLGLDLTSLAAEPFFQAVQKKPAPDGPKPVNPRRQDWHRRQVWTNRDDRNQCSYQSASFVEAEVTALLGEVLVLDLAEPRTVNGGIDPALMPDLTV